MIRVLIFDFDGVIAESNNVKTEAFKVLFSNYPRQIDHIVRFHEENGGMSRFDKFRYIYKNILKKELTEEKFKQLCQSFHELVIDEVVRCPFVPGAKDFLDSCKGNYPMYVVSGTPSDEIKEIIVRKNLRKYFLEIYGSPDSKTKSIRSIIEENGNKPSEILFIGDSKNDYQAAYEVGVSFAARIINDKQEWAKSEYISIVFYDLTELKRYISEASCFKMR